MVDFQFCKLTNILPLSTGIEKKQKTARLQPLLEDYH